MPVIRYRKKPVEVDTIQWTGDNGDEVSQFCTPQFFRGVAPGTLTDPTVTAEVYDVLHSTWVGVKTGHSVVRGVQGELYPIDPDVIVATYDRLDPIG